MTQDESGNLFGEDDRQVQSKLLFEFAKALGIDPVKDEGKTRMGVPKAE